MKAIIHAPNKKFHIQLAHEEEADEKLARLGFVVVDIERLDEKLHITVKGAKNEQEPKASRPHLHG